MNRLQVDPSQLDKLPEELRTRFPDLVEDLRSGLIDHVPEGVLDQLPRSVAERIPESLLAADADTTLVMVLAMVAAIALVGFIWGVTRAAMKAAGFFFTVSALAAVLLYAEI